MIDYGVALLVLYLSIMLIVVGGLKFIFWLLEGYKDKPNSSSPLPPSPAAQQGGGERAQKVEVVLVREADGSFRLVAGDRSILLKSRDHTVFGEVAQYIPPGSVLRVRGVVPNEAFLGAAAVLAALGVESIWD